MLAATTTLSGHPECCDGSHGGTAETLQFSDSRIQSALSRFDSGSSPGGGTGAKLVEQADQSMCHATDVNIVAGRMRVGNFLQKQGRIAVELVEQFTKYLVTYRLAQFGEGRHVEDRSIGRHGRGRGSDEGAIDGGGEIGQSNRLAEIACHANGNRLLAIGCLRKGC